MKHKDDSFVQAKLMTIEDDAGRSEKGVVKSSVVLYKVSEHISEKKRES